MFAKYRKAVAQVAVTVALFVVTVATDGISPVEWMLIVGTLVSSVSTAIVPNLDEGVAAVAKTIVTFALQGLTVLSVSVAGGLTGAELVEALAAALAAIGVTALPNNWPPATLPTRAAPPRAA